MADFDDEFDITEGFDDDDDSFADDPVDDAELEAKQAAFDKLVKSKMNTALKPKQFKKNERLEAVRWLGEAGDPKAIPALVKVYQKDKTPGMKAAAEYSLGMLQQLHLMYDDPETSDEVYETWMSIIVEGKFGKRVNYGAIRTRQIVLFVVFVILVGLALVAPTIKQSDTFTEIFPPTATPSATPIPPTPTPDTVDLAQEALTTYYDDLLNDSNVLQTQMGLVMRGETQDCSVELSNPPTFALSAVGRSNENLVTASDNLNEAATAIAPVREAFAALCGQDAQPIPSGEALNHAQTIIDAQRLMGEAAALLGSDVELPPDPPELPPTATPTPEPSPTVDFSILREHVQTLEFIISQESSGLTESITNWQYALDYGRSEGCFEPAPVYSDNYILPEAIRAEFPELASATDNVNIALDFMREASEAFYIGCDTGSFTNPDRYLQSLAIAQAGFEEAQTILDSLRP